MNDYRQIAIQRKPWQRFVPEAAARLHQDSRRFIEDALGAASIPTVVVTHHLPHAASLPDRFQGDLLNAAYASDLTETMKAGRPALWVHGHTHDCCDHWVGETRVACNPRGYDDENKNFELRRLVNIAAGGLAIA
jgi:Icc-related predicted phosphoesterase